jgi:hypothetical protein
MALRAAVSDTRCAAKAVLFLEPLKPITPPLDQAMTFPSGSVNVTIVLLNVEVIYPLPRGTNFFSFLLDLVRPGRAKSPPH